MYSFINKMSAQPKYDYFLIEDCRPLFLKINKDKNKV